MNEKPARLIEPPTGYADWLSELKTRIHTILKYMRAFAEAWPDAGIVQQAVGQLPPSVWTNGKFVQAVLAQLSSHRVSAN